MGSPKDILAGGLDAIKNRGKRFVDENQGDAVSPLIGVKSAGAAVQKQTKEISTSAKSLGSELWNDAKILKDKLTGPAFKSQRGK